MPAKKKAPAKKKTAAKKKRARIPAKLAAQVIARDLQNIIEKAAAGDPLTDAQRRRITEAAHGPQGDGRPRAEPDNHVTISAETTGSMASYSKLVGLSLRRVKDLVAEGRIPYPAKGKIPLCAGVQNYLASVKARGNSSLEEARTEQALEDAALKRTQRERLEGNLADVDQVIEAETALLTGIEKIIRASSLEDGRKEDIYTAIKDHVRKWADSKS